jgi:two-component system, OmpR family, phosphate regulon sensor histidine kinase PhoR
VWIAGAIIIVVALAIAVPAWGVKRDLARRLAGERALLGAVLGAVGEGVVVLDGKRRILAINDAALRLLDLGERVLDVDLADRVRSADLIALIGRARQRASAEIALPSGSKVAARVLPLDGYDSRGTLLVIDDVTAMRRLETVRKDFVANVSHELRTPVSIIRANAETLLGGAMDDPKAAPKLVDGLHRNAERLARIVTDLLDLSRLDDGLYRIEAVPVDVAQAIAEAVADVEPKAQGKQIAITVDAGALSASCDPKALDQILVNLLDNAVKYTQAGGHVWVRARRAGDRVRVEIADDGPGIPEQHRERVFERFYRVDPGRSREMGGTGLGLSIVKHLVESMGGDVGVEANEPRGSRFWVDLPGSVAAVA